MLVNEWMSTVLITITPDASLYEAANLMKEHNIRRLPVVDLNGHLHGIVTDRDLKDASPSNATTMDVHERYYLFNELTVSECMTKKVLTVDHQDTVERAAVIMLENKISGLPVMDDGRPVGVLTLDDVARVLTVITGAFSGGTQFAFNLEDRPGSIKEVVDVMRHHGGRLMSLLSVYENTEEGLRKVYIRVADMPEHRLSAMIQDLERDFPLLYMERDGRAQF